MSHFKNITENKKFLIGLVVLLLLISKVQTIFLIKLYRYVNQNNAIEKSQNLETSLGLTNDFFKRFDDHAWDPFEEFQSIRERMDRMFDDSYNRFKFSPFFDEKEQGTSLPQTDLIEEEDKYVVKMNIPGADKAEIKVELKDNLLTVTTETQTTKGKKSKDSFLRMERMAGNFKRTIQLPGPVKEGAMKTEYKDGVLIILLPKTLS